jgi:hypothetical protein
MGGLGEKRRRELNARKVFARGYSAIEGPRHARVRLFFCCPDGMWLQEIPSVRNGLY